MHAHRQQRPQYDIEYRDPRLDEAMSDELVRIEEDEN